ncbi:acyl carrier protein [Kitasatospora aburaviensis]
MADRAGRPRGRAHRRLPLLGGHSLAALRVVHLLRRKLNVELQLRHLLDAADLAAFTAAVRRATEAGPAAPRPALTARRAAR